MQSNLSESSVPEVPAKLVAFIEEAIILMIDEADITAEEKEKHKGRVADKLQKKFVNERQKGRGRGKVPKTQLVEKVRTLSN